MKTLVITGGIGSGKSAACDVLRTLGVPVYDSDSRTKSLYDSNHGLVERLEDVLGMSLRLSDGSFDRAALASKVFSGGGCKAKVEAVVHPAVLDDFLKWRDGQAGWLVGFESAIVLEKPLFAGLGDFVLIVDAPVEVRVERAVRRGGMTREQVLARMAEQKFSASQADFVIVNDGSFEDLREKVTKVYNAIYNNTVSRGNNCVNIL